MSFIRYIANENHYKEVLSLVGKAKQTVWIPISLVNRQISGATQLSALPIIIDIDSVLCLPILRLFGGT